MPPSRPRSGAEPGREGDADAGQSRAELPRGGRTIFPDFRVVAYYGAPQDAQLGALGIGRRRRRPRSSSEQAKPYGRKSRPVLPAMELIAVVAAAHPGPGDRYNLRQPDAVIRRYLKAARKAKALLILDIQPGRSDFFTETKRLRKWLKEPDVGLALDPEWRMSRGPGPREGHRQRRLARGQRHHGVAGPARDALQAAAEAAADPPVHRRHGPRGGAQGAQGPGLRPQRRRLRHPVAEDRQVQGLRRAGQAVPARLQALLRRGPEHHDARRRSCGCTPRPDVVVYE